MLLCEKKIGLLVFKVIIYLNLICIERRVFSEAQNARGSKAKYFSFKLY